MDRKLIATVKVMKHGRVTIPSDIREYASIEPGSYVEITIEKLEQLNERQQEFKNAKGVANNG